MNQIKRTAFAISGLGGNNAYGAGFLAAVQEATSRQGITTGLHPGLEMISCTSGAIASTATYLRGGDLRAQVQVIDDAGAAVVAVEHRGTGGVGGAAKAVGLKGVAQDLAALGVRRSRGRERASEQAQADQDRRRAGKARQRQVPILTRERAGLQPAWQPERQR